MVLAPLPLFFLFNSMYRTICYHFFHDYAPTCMYNAAFTLELFQCNEHHNHDRYAVVGDIATETLPEVNQRLRMIW